MFSISKIEKVSYGVVGLGRFGYALSMELANFGADLLVVDKDEDKVRELREYTDNTFVVKSLDKKTLSETGIQNCEVAIVCIGEHMESSILTTLNLVSLKIPTVISKANSAEHGEILEKLGAEVVYPERDMAIRLANRLENINMLDFIQLSEKINISKQRVPEKFIGKTMSDINLRSGFGLNIIAIETSGGIVVEDVGPDYIFKKNDVMYLSGSKDGVLRLMEFGKI